MARHSMYVDPVAVHFSADRKTRSRLQELSMRTGKPVGRLLEDALDALEYALRSQGQMGAR